MSKYRFVMMAVACMALCGATSFAMPQPDEEDYDESIRKPIRRLHPERERAKAIKQWEEEQARKAAAQQQQGGAAAHSADPWAESGVDVPDGKEALYELLNKDYSLKQYVPDGPKRLQWVDEPVSASMSDLLPHFDKNGGRYTPRGTTMKQSENAIYFYFVDNGPLRLRVQYFADDPLNFSEMVFTIDGFEYHYRPSGTQRGRQGTRFYWETSDEALGTADRDLVYALTHCHWARVKLLGANGIDHVKMFTTGQLEDFARLWQLYRLKGGTL